MSYFALVLALCGFLAVQVLIGGTRLCFLLPGVALIGLAGVAGLFAKIRPQFPIGRVAMISTVLFFGYILVHVQFFSPYPYLARIHFFMILAGLIMYFLTACVWTTQRQRLTVFWVVVAMALAHVVVGAIQFKTESGWLPFGLIRPDYQWRASGFYICPNHIAGYFEAVAMLLAGITLWSRVPIAAKLLAGYLLLVVLAGQIITGSRGGWLSIACGFAAFTFGSLVAVFYALRERLLVASLAVVLVVAGIFGSAMYALENIPGVLHRYENILNQKNDRFYLWEAGWHQFLLDPVWGTGAGTYLRYGREFRPPRSFGSDPIHVHNDYVHLLAEFGTVGFALMLFFVVAHIGNGWDSFKWILRARMRRDGVRTSNTAALQLGALAAVFALLAHSAVDFNMHIPGNVLLMGWIFGVLANPGVATRSSPPAGTKAFAIGGKYLAAALGIWVLLPIPRQLPAEIYAEKARVQVREGNGLEAIAMAKRGLEHDPTNPELHHHIGAARLDLAQKMKFPVVRRHLFMGAARAFAEGLEYFPNDFWRLLYLGMALDGAGRSEDAILVFRRAIELDPHVHYAWAQLAWTQEEAGDLPGALESYRQASRRWPESWIGEKVRELTKQLGQ